MIDYMKMPFWLVLFLILFAATGVVTHINFADELVFLSMCSWAVVSWIRNYWYLDRKVFNLALLILAAFAVALFIAVVKNRPVIVSIMGFWQLWRAHIAILLGFVLLTYGKKIPPSPILLLLQFNAAFSLIQPALGEGLMAIMYPAGIMEYRSGILRSVGIFGNPNTNAFFLVLYALYLSGQILLGNAGRFSKTFLLISVLALFETGSRTGILVLPCIMSFMAWSVRTRASALDKSSRTKVSFSTYLVGFGLVVGIGVYLSSHQDDSTSGGYSFIPDLDVVTNTENMGEGYFRAIATVMAVGRFIDNPIFGLGYGTYGTPASFAWKSPYLEEDGLLGGDGSVSETGAVLTQLDTLFPVILAESGMVGILLWVCSLWGITKMLSRYSYQGGLVFNAWIIALLVGAISGPGITSPVVVVLIPFVMNFLQGDEK